MSNIKYKAIGAVLLTIFVVGFVISYYYDNLAPTFLGSLIDALLCGIH